MLKMHVLGMPRMGAGRELKWALESHWRGEMDAAALQVVARRIRQDMWRMQAEAGCDFVAVGDFSLYDHVLDMAARLGVVPARFGWDAAVVDDDLYFRMARGRDAQGRTAQPLEMTKWFDTNYHYLVPELSPGQRFTLSRQDLLEQVGEAKALGYAVKAVLLGPLTFLWLAKAPAAGVDKLDLLPDLLAAYGQLFIRLRQQGVAWVQLDEPILALDLPAAWRRAFESAYHALQGAGVPTLVATYFGALEDNLLTAARLPVAGLHVDAVCAAHELVQAADWLPGHKVLSVGIVDGRNVWRTDLGAALERLAPVHARLGERLWLASSCSLLHVPLDLQLEQSLDAELKGWLAFGRQKLEELALLRRALVEGREAVTGALAQNAAAMRARGASGRGRDPKIRQRLATLSEDQFRRAHPYAVRAPIQAERLGLPWLPTTTIGSFPQTADIRAARRDYKSGRITQAQYEARMRQEIRRVIEAQERLGLDVLVHGEPERSDMVEYFAERLEGFALTEHGWVQSYGSRCVRPPILYGDIHRPGPMTVAWSTYAQSLTQRPVKGMLTGPITLLKWSFVRDDQSWSDTALQLALALRDEIRDLEAAGIRVIQVDEPAFREALPLRRQRQDQYLTWAVRAFRLATSGVRDDTQIHTHMCYSEFNDIIAAIAELDADVITIETARSGMVLLQAFTGYAYPNGIGPGVYDIHSPNVPEVEAMMGLITQAAGHIPAERLWVNPDCGLKTRSWSEVEQALAHMVEAARRMRASLAEGRGAATGS